MLSGLLLGVPLVAAGITSSQFGVRWIECMAAWFFGGACIWFALEQLRLALAVRYALVRGLLFLSSLSLIAAMSLALLYATGNYLQMHWLDIPFMLRWHGPIQVFGSIGLVLGGVGGLWTMILVFEKMALGRGLANRPALLLAVLLVVVGVQFISLGLLGEMIARTYHESQNKPIYTIKEEF